jgi:hypothetical protein
MNQKHLDSIQDICFKKAQTLIENGCTIGDNDVFLLTDLLVKVELEKFEKDMLSDSNLEYNDEIVSIEPVGELETIDISVTGDNLFYCNDILTKNSHGVVMTVDLMIALIRTEELDNLNQSMIKQIANRYNDINYYKRFVVGRNAAKMRFYDVEEKAQTDNISDGGYTNNSSSNENVSMNTFIKSGGRASGGFGGFQF